MNQPHHHHHHQQHNCLSDEIILFYFIFIFIFRCTMQAANTKTCTNNSIRTLKGVKIEEDYFTPTRNSDRFILSSSLQLYNKHRHSLFNQLSNLTKSTFIIFRPIHINNLFDKKLGFTFLQKYSFLSLSLFVLLSLSGFFFPLSFFSFILCLFFLLPFLLPQCARRYHCYCPLKWQQK
ncbi:hypothetical protein DFH27DRAFT_147233 [Peziza echinospora]|nr:hypothetical protein DFH27DRAFT_147233 [Peziza echinospora]